MVIVAGVPVLTDEGQKDLLIVGGATTVSSAVLLGMPATGDWAEVTPEVVLG